MLTEWSYAGFSLSEFWASTPREYHAVMDGVYRRSISDYNLAMQTAYRTAELSRAKRIPSLKSLLINPEKPDHSNGQVSAGEGLRAWAAVIQAATKAQRGK